MIPYSGNSCNTKINAIDMCGNINKTTIKTKIWINHNRILITVVAAVEQ